MRFNVVVLDFGVEQIIFRCSTSFRPEVAVVPGTKSATKILGRNINGIFLSNSSGGPASRGRYAFPMVKTLVKSGKPIFGIHCCRSNGSYQFGGA